MEASVSGERSSKGRVEGAAADSQGLLDWRLSSARLHGPLGPCLRGSVAEHLLGPQKVHSQALSPAAAPVKGVKEEGR